MTASVPAEPVKPENHSRVFQCVAVYSLKCGSAGGMMNADNPCACMKCRRPDILSEIAGFMASMFSFSGKDRERCVQRQMKMEFFSWDFAESLLIFGAET